MANRSANHTFLFTDVVGSTRLWQQHESAMRSLLETHDSAIRSAIEEHGGRVFAGGGDGFGAVFDDPTSAVSAALSAQRSLKDLGLADDPLLVRMGLHSGGAEERGGDFFGIAVNRAARISSAAHGGQVLLSETTAEMIDSEPLTRLGEVRLVDLFEPLVIFQAGEGEFPPIRALDPARHNLPFRFTSLIGRGELIDQVLVGIADVRLVTLVGPGGIGKTSVALEVGARFLPEADRGVWLAELDRLSPGSDVESVIAEAVRLDPIEGWRRTAARRDQLVILDNAEHVIETTARAALTLLKAGPAIRLLVTSREALGIPGELVIDVPPLNVDDATDLFVDRAAGIQIDDEAVEEAVRRTGGVPLATELVAAHTGRVPMRELVRSLEEHGVGSFSGRGTSDRHRSARAAIEWSHALLSPEERSAFEATSVFSGEFTIDQAAALAEATPSLIVGLVEKSLIQRVDDRYQLLEPIKEFAREKLDERGALGVIERRHATLMAAVVEELAVRLGPRDFEAWADDFDLPGTDFVAALGWAVDHADVELLVRLYRAVPGLLLDAGLVETAVDRLEPAAAIWLEHPWTYRWELHRHAWIEDFTDREEQAREKLLVLQNLPEVTADPHLNAACSLVHLKSHQHTPGTIEHYESLAADVKAYQGDTGWWEPGVPDAVLGQAYLRIGDLDKARRALESALTDETMRLPNRVGTMSDLAEVEREAGNIRRSLAILDEIVVADSGIERQVAQEKAHAYIAMGEPDRARDHLRPLIEWDLSQAQPTTQSFCAAADYHRELGDHRTAVWLLSKMLGRSEPAFPVHDQIINQARAHLGDQQFETEWARGRDMDIYTLYALLAQEP